jgi:hypothetical protein
MNNKLKRIRNEAVLVYFYLYSVISGGNEENHGIVGLRTDTHLSLISGKLATLRTAYKIAPYIRLCLSVPYALNNFRPDKSVLIRFDTGEF